MTPSRRIVECVTCGQRRPNQGRGQCSRCYQNDPALVHRCAESLAVRLNPEPNWWIGFGKFLAERAAATRAVSMLHRLATDLDRIGTATPTAVLEAIRNPGPAVGELARALEAYFVESGLALALDTTAQAAAERRSRRLAEITDQFHPLAAAFDTHQLQSRERARRSGTKPRSDRTLEINLAAIRDLARYLIVHRPAVTDWTLVDTGDVEAFLASITNPSNRARHLHALQGFFRFARQKRHILADPTRRLNANSNTPFHGRGARTRPPTRAVSPMDPRHRGSAPARARHRPARAAARRLCYRTAIAAHRRRRPHRGLRRSRPSTTPTRSTRLPQPRCATACTTAMTTTAPTPWLLVNQKSKTVGKQVSLDYLAMILAPGPCHRADPTSDPTPQLVTTMDPVLVAAAFGVRRGTVLRYLADSVDPTRLPNL